MPIPPRRPVTLAVRAARLRAVLHPGRPLSRRSPRVRTALVVAFMCLDLAVAGIAAAERSPAADVYFERGGRALRQGEAADAVEDLAEAARLAPGDAAVLSRYAQALLAAGKPKQALAALEQLRELDPEVPDLAFMEGLAQLRLAHWPEAVAQLEVARSEAPDSARVALLLGTAYQESGSVPEAEKEFAEALVLDPTLEPQVRYLRAIAAAGRKDRASAHRLFEQLRAEFPGSELARSAAAHAELLGLGGERRWSAFASVGLEYDSNANFAGEDPALLASRQGDGAAVFQAGIDGTVFRRDPFLVRVGYSGYLSAYQDLHDFDIEANSLFGEATYKISRASGSRARSFATRTAPSLRIRRRPNRTRMGPCGCSVPTSTGFRPSSRVGDAASFAVGFATATKIPRAVSSTLVAGSCWRRWDSTCRSTAFSSSRDPGSGVASTSRVPSSHSGAIARTGSRSSGRAYVGPSPRISRSS